MSRVSVVMPVHNGEARLHEALRSVLEQTMQDFELIVVDDGSTDATPEIVLSYADPRVRLIRQEAAGISSALNRGIAEATAPLVARMDADDESRPQRLEKQLAFMEAHPEVGCLGTAFEAISYEGEHESFRGVPLGHADLVRTLQWRSPFCHGSVMFRRDLVVAAGGYDSAWEPAEDFELWRRLASLTELAALPEVLYRHRSNPHGASASQPARQVDRARSLVARRDVHFAAPTVRAIRQAQRALPPTVPHRPQLEAALLLAQELGAKAVTRNGSWGEALRAWWAFVVAGPQGARLTTRRLLTGLRALLGRAARGDDRRRSSGM